MLAVFGIRTHVIAQSKVLGGLRLIVLLATLFKLNDGDSIVGIVLLVVSMRVLLTAHMTRNATMTTPPAL